MSAAKDKSKVHKLSIKGKTDATPRWEDSEANPSMTGSAKLVSEFVSVIRLQMYYTV